MTGQATINGADIFSNYGATFMKGSYNDIMSPATPRKRLENEYVDANGSKVDIVSALTYEPRRFSIQIAISATSFSQFWTRYNGLIGAIATPGTFALYVSDLGITCNLLYEGAKCVQKPRSLRSGGMVVIYEISVYEPNPKNRTYGA